VEQGANSGMKSIDFSGKGSPKGWRGSTQVPGGGGRRSTGRKELKHPCKSPFVAVGALTKGGSIRRRSSKRPRTGGKKDRWGKVSKGPQAGKRQLGGFLGAQDDGAFPL